MMKKFGFLFIVLLAIVMMPFSVFADEAEADGSSEESGEAVEEVSDGDGTEVSNEVKVYFFRGEGCEHCAEAEEWFDSIEEEYGSKYEIIDYEVWSNEDNADLMQRVSDARDDDADGVPYIIIGNHSWNGFRDSYKDEILDEINSEYEKDPTGRYDIMQLLPSLEGDKGKSKSSDIVATIIIVLVIGGVTYGIIQARKKTY